MVPPIIQGGMGVAISDWRLARAVARHGQLGVVSGTGIALALIARLQRGDPGGHVRRALAAFPHAPTTEELLERYLVPGGKAPDAPDRRPSMWSVAPPDELVRLTVAANFVEVWLAREGHDGQVGINLLEKIQLPHLSSLYGAMLAGVDVVIMGAGVPTQVPGILDRLSHHRPVAYRLDVVGGPADDAVELQMDPRAVLPGIAERAQELRRPAFLPIVSSTLLAKAMLRRATGSVEGYVVEAPTAGGHNAPPRGRLELDKRGEPIYGKRDAIDPTAFAALERPYWLAGGYGRPGGLAEARAAGAAGIQVGTAFAFCAESGMEPGLRRAALRRVADGAGVRTDPRTSPTGFPFKVVDLPGSLSEVSVYQERERRCDLGFLRAVVRREDGRLDYRCPAEPLTAFIAKGGKPEDAEGRVCLCNALAATAGMPQVRKDGQPEPPIVTAGDDLQRLAAWLPEILERDVSAAEILELLLAED